MGTGDEGAGDEGVGDEGAGDEGVGERGRGIRAHLPAKGSSTHGCRANQRTAAALNQLGSLQLHSSIQSPLNSEYRAPMRHGCRQLGTRRSRTEARRCDIVSAMRRACVEHLVLNLALSEQFAGRFRERDPFHPTPRPRPACARVFLALAASVKASDSLSLRVTGTCSSYYSLVVLLPLLLRRRGDLIGRHDAHLADDRVGGGFAPLDVHAKLVVHHQLEEGRIPDEGGNRSLIHVMRGAIGASST